MPMYHDMGKMRRLMHLTIKSCSSSNGETTHINTCRNTSCCRPFEPLLPRNLAHTHYNESNRLCTLSLNKFGSMTKGWTLTSIHVRTYPLYCPFEPLLLCSLTHTHYDVRHGVGAQVMRVIDYAHFALNELRSLSITLSYNALPLITSNNTSTHLPPNPILAQISLDPSVHSQL